MVGPGIVLQAGWVAEKDGSQGDIPLLAKRYTLV
jgi:hypothetical protein